MNESRESIRLSDWLAARAPRPPDELSAALHRAVGDARCDETELAATLVAKAKTLLLNAGIDREAAIDLLAADALVTYAMEAAAENGSIDLAATHAMQELAGIVK